MSNENRFCYRCGATLPDGSVFCPECGTAVDGSQPPREFTPNRTVSSKKNPLSPVPVLIMIYGVLAALGAIMLFILAISVDGILEMLKELAENGQITWDDYNSIKDLFNSYSMPIQTVFFLMGAIFLASGAAAIMAGAGASDLKEWKRTVTLCGVAAVIPFFLAPFDILNAIILPAVGIIMTYMIYKHKADFKS
jgi:hypothetical protein